MNVSTHRPASARRVTHARWIASPTRASVLALACALGLPALTGCAVVQGQESMGTYIDDRTITAQVKTRLLEDRSTSGLAVDVDTQEGTVTLSGYAKTAAEKSQAESLARSTKGVRNVRNLLVVRP
jgi:hyperosmotically inducible protein